MAFEMMDFSAIGGEARRGEAPMIFAYMTIDDASAVAAAGYFNPAFGNVWVGDVINVVTVTRDTDGTPLTATGLKVFLVAAINADTKVVTVAAQ